MKHHFSLSFFYLFLFLNTTQLFGQYDLGTTWTYRPWCIAPACGLQTLEVISDTIILNEEYQVIETTRRHIYWPDSSVVDTFFLSDKNGEVGYFADGGLKPLYNLNLAVGDTMTTYVDSVTFSIVGSHAVENPDAFIRSVVTEVDTVEMQGKMLKRIKVFDLKEEYNTCWVLDFNGEAEIIENIGLIYASTFFGTPCALLAGGIHGHLQCYSDNSISINFKDTYDCDELFDFTNAIAHQNQKIVTKIASFPNPTSDVICFNENTFQSNQEVFVEIIDVSGKRIYNSSLFNAKEQVCFDVSSYPSGLYMIRIQNDFKIFVSKFVIQ